MLRERLDASMESRSTTTMLGKPSSARFLRISLSSAPAPLNSPRAERTLSWSHQPMRRKRLNRSSFTGAVMEPPGDATDLLILLLRGFPAAGAAYRLFLLGGQT